MMNIYLNWEYFVICNEQDDSCEDIQLTEVMCCLSRRRSLR